MTDGNKTVTATTGKTNLNEKKNTLQSSRSYRHFIFDLMDTFMVKSLLFLVYLIVSNKGIKLRGLVR